MDAVQANLLAATTQNPEAVNQVYFVAVGDRTTLNNLYSELRRLLAVDFPLLADAKPTYRDFRAGDDVRHSQADIGNAAARLLGYAPTQRIGKGFSLRCLGTSGTIMYFECQSQKRKPQSQPSRDPTDEGSVHQWTNLRMQGYVHFREGLFTR